MFNFNPSWLLRSFGFGSTTDQWDQQNRQGSMASRPSAPSMPSQQAGRQSGGLMSQNTGAQQLSKMIMDYKPPAQPKPAQQKPVAAPVQTAPRPAEPAMQASGAMSQQAPVVYNQQSVLGPTYRPPAQSAWANFENPFTKERQALLEAQAVQQAEEQAAVQAQKLGSQLASAGLMSGGGTGLSQSLAQQLAMQTAGQRSQALRDIGLQVPMQRADLEARRAAALDAWAPTAFGMSERIALQPSTIRRAEAEADIAGTQARRGEQMLPLDIQRAEEEIRAIVSNTAGGDIRNRQAQLDLAIASRPDVINARLKDIIASGELKGVELDAALAALYQANPNAWWNREEYKFLKEAIMAIVSGGAQAAGRALAAGGGK